ncbi:CHC2 zinc finger domain-containing protein [Actinoplanes sp. NPDC051470]|uniref:CHC2 zinc finger domain-containing protein n=1 Tax=Actinoplanes sp. NPDC051470 TaxID=3157224 RepID=UPI0034404EF8
MVAEKPSIAALLEHYGADFVPEGGRWRSMKCPFHEDRNASASVSTTLQRFRCFACAINSEDAYGLAIWKGDATDFVSAIEFLERILGPGNVRVPRQSHERSGGRSRRRVFDSGPRPVEGQRSILSARLRRKPFSGT